MPCLQVSKKLGEKAVVAVRKLKLFDPNFKVERDENFIYIPLLHKLSSAENRKLKENLPEFKIITYTFSIPKKKPKKLIEILEDQLPPHLLASIPHSMDFIGDIAVVEIPPELEPHKRLIGKAILKIHKRVKTVLAKAGAVSGVYRTREFETIAGEDKTKTIHKEHGCIFHVDLAKAYFSPRLSHEHHRVSTQVKEGEIVVDMFAGVGPFSIQIAKQHENVHVYAVDMNPHAVELLKKNIIVNRVEAKVTPILGDIRKVVAERLAGVADHAIMNLPEKAIEYIGTACKAIKREGGIIHYYEFTNAPNPIEKAKVRLTEAVKQQCPSRKLHKTLFAKVVRATAPFTYQVVVDAQIQ